MYHESKTKYVMFVVSQSFGHEVAGQAGRGGCIPKLLSLLPSLHHFVLFSVVLKNIKAAKKIGKDFLILLGGK